MADSLGKSIQEVFQGLSFLLPSDDGYESYLEDVVMKGTPEAVFRPASVAELQGILKLCSENQIPFTPCGCQTSVTGASVALEGILISMEKLNQVLDVQKLDHGMARVRVQPGMILAQFQEEMERFGYFYPPDPTSREEVQLGATVATNATGEDSYHYGGTRSYVLALEVLTSKGEKVRLTRDQDPLTLSREKNKAGYILGESIDPWIGSEGTLGVISELELLVLKKPGAFVGLLLFFTTESNTLEFVKNIDGLREKLQLRCVEYLDHSATDIIRDRSGGYRIPPSITTLYLKFEPRDEGHLEGNLGILEDLYSKLDEDPELFSQALLAQDRSELLDFRRMRHHVPATINEIAHSNRKFGGGKIGSDWWIPLSSLTEQFEFMRSQLRALDIPVIAFGHIGNGHPHVNLLPKDSSQKEIALKATQECMANAARLGGGVAGEHGLGKIKTWALNIQWESRIIEKMKLIKKQWDPTMLCSPGNIFPREDS